MLKLGLWLQGFHLEFDLCPAVFFIRHLLNYQLVSLLQLCVYVFPHCLSSTLTLTPSQRLLISLIANQFLSSVYLDLSLSLYVCVRT